MAFFPGTSVVQWGPGAPMGLVQCLPYICPILPKGWLEEVRGSHPQGQLGGWQGLLGEGQEGSMSVCPGKGGHQLPGRPSPPVATLPLSWR